MHKKTITTKYTFGDKVCRIADPDKLCFVVIALIIDRKDIMYQIRGEQGVFTLYDFEILPYEERLGVLN